MIQVIRQKVMYAAIPSFLANDANATLTLPGAELPYYRRPRVISQAQYWLQLDQCNSCRREPHPTIKPQHVPETLRQVNTEREVNRSKIAVVEQQAVHVGSSKVNAKPQTLARKIRRLTLRHLDDGA